MQLRDSEVYGCHPRMLKTYKTGLQRVADHVDPLTAESIRIMSKRKKQIRRGTNNDAHWYRLRIITEANAALTFGPLVANLSIHPDADAMVQTVRNKTWRRRHPQQLLHHATAPERAHDTKTCRYVRTGFASVSAP